MTPVEQSIPLQALESEIHSRQTDRPESAADSSTGQETFRNTAGPEPYSSTPF
jgi:hypothetical protein